MGSKSDLKHMQAGIDLLGELGVAHEVRIVSAHRTPDWMFEYAASAEGRGIEGKDYVMADGDVVEFRFNV